MTAVVLDDIPFQPDMALLRQQLRIRPGNSYNERLDRLVSEAQAIARPRALYKVALIDDKGDDYVVLDGVRFDSRVLRVNLEPVHRVFPYVATCGRELHNWAETIDDMLLRFWADTVNELALRTAMAALDAHLLERYQPGQTATMNPGSLGEWPIQQQRALFKLLGDPGEAIGVQLMSSYLMVPQKSVSGIQFSTQERFFNCQLCPRGDCPSRKAPYDAGLYDKKYRLAT